MDSKQPDQMGEHIPVNQIDEFRQLQFTALADRFPLVQTEQLWQKFQNCGYEYGLCADQIKNGELHKNKANHVYHKANDQLPESKNGLTLLADTNHIDSDSDDENVKLIKILRTTSFAFLITDCFV